MQETESNGKEREAIFHFSQVTTLMSLPSLTCTLNFQWILVDGEW